jgi:hypothetical protein
MTMLKKIALYTGLVLGVYLFVTWLGGCLAHADTGAPTAADGVTSLLAKHGWWGGALIAYSALAWLLRRNASEKWIAQGRTLAIITAAVSVVGSILSWRLGLDPDAVIYALTGAIPLVMSPTVEKRPAPVTASGETSGTT